MIPYVHQRNELRLQWADAYQKLMVPMRWVRVLFFWKLGWRIGDLFRLGTFWAEGLIFSPAGSGKDMPLLTAARSSQALSRTIGDHLKCA